MAWCYTFGVAIGDGSCRDPMLVVEGESRCLCTSCGTECRGRFPGCDALVFAPGGRELQLRSLPVEIRSDQPAAGGAAATNGRAGAPGDAPATLSERLIALEQRLVAIEEDLAQRPHPPAGRSWFRSAAGDTPPSPG